VKRTIICFYLFLFLTSNNWGQIADTCQCRLIYGNWLHTTLVTFHHDSFVTYENSRNPKDTIFNFIRKNGSKDTVFVPEFYDWLDYKKTYSIRNGNIGNKIGLEFFTEFPIVLQDTNEIIKTFYLEKIYWCDSFILAAKKITFNERLKINNSICNCYDYDKYFYSGDFNKIELTFQKLNSIQFTNYGDTFNPNAFILEDGGCGPNLNISKTCYLQGVGIVSVTTPWDQPFPKEIKLNIVYLTNSCKKYLNEKFLSYPKGIVR
jgi:hypothetical protein